MYSMFVAVMAFFARISDPMFGGTNMTLLNTLTNLGGAWANTAALWLTDFLTFKQCSNNANNICSTEAEINVSINYLHITRTFCSMIYSMIESSDLKSIKILIRLNILYLF